SAQRLAEQAGEMRIEKQPARVELPAQRAKIVEARIERAQLWRTEIVDHAPVRATAVARHQFGDWREVVAESGLRIGRYRDAGAVAIKVRRQPVAVGGDEAHLDREMDAERQ